MDNAVSVSDFREVRSNTLCGFCNVELPSGLVLHDVSIHKGEDGVWVGMPSRQMLDRDGQPVRDQNGRTRYINLVNFVSRARRDALSRQIITAFSAKYPGVLD